MIFLFVADTGASMNQMASHGMTLLDCVKASVEYFVKLRGNRGDSFYLVDCAEGLSAVKSYKTNVSSFLNELKNLEAVHISNIGPALKTSFDLVNLFRIQNSSDTYGVGRYTWISEPAMVILLSNGRLNSNDGIVKNLTLPLQPHQPGSELTKEPFRWDQKLISIALRFPAYTQTATTKQYTTIAGNPNAGENMPPIKPVTSDSEDPIALMCQVTGGKCYHVHSMKELLHCMEQLLATFLPFQQPGVVVNFEKITYSRIPPTDYEKTLGEEDPNALSIPQSASHITIHRAGSAGFWPIPEAYVMDPNQSKLQPRTAQPYICFRPVAFEGFIQKSFPFDKYLIERCELTDWMIKHSIGSCWPVFVPNSSPTGQNEPFGYIKASAGSVSLYVLPFNFPRLRTLLDDLLNMMKVPSIKWRQEFEAYLNSIPFYYAQPLSKALKRFGIASNIVPDHLDGSLPSAVVTKLKNLKQLSKKESNRWYKELSKVTGTTENAKLATNDKNAKKQTKSASNGDEKNAISVDGVRVNIKDKNAFDITRGDLLDRIQRMRTHVFTKDSYSSEEAKHNVPISQMGNFQDTMMKREVLRDVFEIDDARKRPIFGNPYRNDKSPRVGGNNIIDEAETGGDSPRKPKAKEQSGKVKNPLISGLFVSADEPDIINQEPKVSPVTNVAIQEDIDVSMLDNNELEGFERFEAKKRIRDSNVSTKVEIIKLFRGRKVGNENSLVLKKLLTLRGNKATKKLLIKLLIEKAIVYKKPEAAQLLHKHLAELSLVNAK